MADVPPLYCPPSSLGITLDNLSNAPEVKQKPAAEWLEGEMRVMEED
jgi:hypothetical protein